MTDPTPQEGEPVLGGQFLGYRVDQLEKGQRRGAETFSRVRGWLLGVSVGLVGTLVTGGVIYGRQSERLDAVQRLAERQAATIDDLRTQGLEAKLRVEGTAKALDEERARREQLEAALREQGRRR